MRSSIYLPLCDSKQECCSEMCSGSTVAAHLELCLLVKQKQAK